MRTLAIIFALLISGFATEAQETAKDTTGTISVEILNVTSDNGKIVYGIYTKDSFMKKPDFSKSAKIKDGKSVVTFTNIPAGKYAVICFHDKNDNDKMDFETNGMPQENYGVSNNKLNPYGPPVWDDGKFTFDGNEKEITIRF